MAHRPAAVRLVLLTSLLTPALADDGAVLPPAEAVTERLDQTLEQAWTEAQLTPAPRSDDAEFIRRLYLDVTGTIPDEATVRNFLTSRAPAKRAHAVEAALADPGYSRSMALRWAYALVGREYLIKSMDFNRAKQAAQQLQQAMEPGMMPEPPASDGPVPPLVAWLEGQLQKDTPWDEVVRKLLTAEGRADEEGSVHYLLRYVRDGKAEELTGNALRVFQGLQLQCAQCHDHPYSAWKQQDFYGVAAFFSRMAARRLPGPDGTANKGPFQVYERKDGQIRIPAPPGERGRMVLPRFLTGQVVNPAADVDRRAAVAALITAPDNPWFAKAAVNRVWATFFGRGLISPVDDLESSDGAAVPAALELLAKDFQESGYDLRRLCRVILNSKAYERTSAGEEAGREAALALFARAPLRSLSAEQLFNSVLEASGAEDVRTANPAQRRRVERFKYQVLRQFLQTFGDDEGEEVVEEGTIPQALLLLNGPLTNDAIRPRAGHPLYDQLFRLDSHEARIDAVYLRVLGRHPRERERELALKLVQDPAHRAAAEQAQVYADLVWSLLNSSEFAVNH